MNNLLLVPTDVRNVLPCPHIRRAIIQLVFCARHVLGVGVCTVNRAFTILNVIYILGIGYRPIIIRCAARVDNRRPTTAIHAALS
jgi:hypothetical protein